MAYVRFGCGNGSGNWYAYYCADSVRDTRDNQMLEMIHANRSDAPGTDTRWTHRYVEYVLTLQEAEIIEIIRSKYGCSHADAQEAIGYLYDFVTDVAESSFPSDDDPDEIKPVLGFTPLSAYHATLKEIEPVGGVNPNNFHVIPIGDIEEHISSTECWCAPTPDEEVPTVFVHHSLDGREDSEAAVGYRKLSAEETALIYSMGERVKELSAFITQLEAKTTVEEQWGDLGKRAIEQGLMSLASTTTLLRNPLFNNIFK